MKRCIADGSVGIPHVRVGHRQASKHRAPDRKSVSGVFLAANSSPAALISAVKQVLGSRLTQSAQCNVSAGQNPDCPSEVTVLETS